jgi:hypothetical protein
VDDTFTVCGSAHTKAEHNNMHNMKYIMTQCMRARIVEPEKMSNARQWLGKHAPAAMNTHVTTEELLGMLFPMLSELKFIGRANED